MTVMHLSTMNTVPVSVNVIITDNRMNHTCLCLEFKKTLRALNNENRLTEQGLTSHQTLMVISRTIFTGHNETMKRRGSRECCAKKRSDVAIKRTFKQSGSKILLLCIVSYYYIAHVLLLLCLQSPRYSKQ